MEFVKTIEELNACVESIEKGTGTFRRCADGVIIELFTVRIKNLS